MRCNVDESNVVLPKLSILANNQYTQCEQSRLIIFGCIPDLFS
jgi:hypothetical protein